MSNIKQRVGKLEEKKQEQTNLKSWPQLVYGPDAVDNDPYDPTMTWERLLDAAQNAEAKETSMAIT